MRWTRQHPWAALVTLLLFCGAIAASRANSPTRAEVLQWDVEERPDPVSEGCSALVRALEKLKARSGR